LLVVVEVETLVVEVLVDIEHRDLDLQLYKVKVYR
jgi:hypothetical protein